ncbi:MAG: glycosyltransferase family 4 protein [Chloroflexi bacterium]|nr:glycosyltransferase family 4 protein [Chloroflexota bacterium]
MNIGIEAGHIQDGSGGIYDYLLALIDSLGQVDIKNNYRLFYLTGLLGSPVVPDFGLPHVKNTFIKKLFKKDILEPKDVDLFFMPDTTEYTYNGNPPLVAGTFGSDVLLHPENYPNDRIVKTRNMLSTIKQAAKTIVYSNNSKNQLCSKFLLNANKVTVSRLAPHPRFRTIDEQQVREVLSKRYGINDNYILAPADSVTRMNLLRLLEAFSDIIRTPELSKYMLFVQGEPGWESDKVAARLKTGNLVGKVAFLKGVTSDERIILMNGATLVVYPPLSEETGVPVMEAMACGTPVACSDIPVHRELFEDAVAYFHPLDTKEMSYAIRKILFEHDFSRSLTAAGIGHVKKFDWRTAATDHLDAFKQATGVLSINTDTKK